MIQDKIVAMALEERVERGAQILDYNRPNWRDGVDVEALDLGRTESCVLGQLFGDWFDGLLALTVIDNYEAAAAGFTLLVDYEPPAWAKLTELWKTAVRSPSLVGA